MPRRPPRRWLVGAGLVLVVGAVLALTWNVGDRPDQTPKPPEGAAASRSAQNGATAAQAATSTTADDGTASPGIITDPSEGVGPEGPGDPGGWQQALVFAVVVLGLAGVVLGIWRSARRARRRAASRTFE